MAVIAFPPKAEFDDGGWTSAEREQLEKISAARVAAGEASGFATAVTETGDPQFFLLGPEPSSECVLGISRVAGRYLIEDGEGRLITETDSLREVFDLAMRLRLRRSTTGLIAGVVVGWREFRNFVNEKLEAFVGETPELAEALTHFMPQAAAFA